MLRSLAQQSEEKGLSGTASLQLHRKPCVERTPFSHASHPCSKYGLSARPLAVGLLRITEHAASQPNSGRLETSVRRCILHASHHGLPTSGGGHKRAKKGTFDPALLARLKVLGITCFGCFVALAALCWYQLSTRALRTVADKAYIPQIPYTHGVAIQRAGPNVCDDTSECPYGGGLFGVTPPPGFITVRDNVNGDMFP